MFAIRQISTGYWLPPKPGRAGGTWVEPAADSLPRLFRTKAQASSCLHWWLGGQVRMIHNMWDENLGELAVTRVPSRNAAAMEVIEVIVLPLPLTDTDIVILS